MALLVGGLGPGSRFSANDCKSAVTCLCIMISQCALKLTYRMESAPLKNLTVHAIIIIYKIHSTNSGVVRMTLYMPSFSDKIFGMIQ